MTNTLIELASDPVFWFIVVVVTGVALIVLGLLAE